MWCPLYIEFKYTQTEFSMKKRAPDIIYLFYSEML